MIVIVCAAHGALLIAVLEVHLRCVLVYSRYVLFLATTCYAAHSALFIVVPASHESATTRPASAPSPRGYIILSDPNYFLLLFCIVIIVCAVAGRTEAQQLALQVFLSPEGVYSCIQDSFFFECKLTVFAQSTSTRHKTLDAAVQLCQCLLATTPPASQRPLALQALLVVAFLF